MAITEDSDVYKYAIKFGLSAQIYSQDSVVDMLADESFDLGILAWWPTIINKQLIELPKSGFINFHPSFLPFNRGKHYNFWAIVEEAPFGVSLHRVTEGIDDGDIVCQKSIEYDWTDTGKSLYTKAQKEICGLFTKNYPVIRSADLTLVSSPQNLTIGSFHFAKEMFEKCEIDLKQSYSARHLLNLLRARTFDGHPGCWFAEKDGNQYEVSINIKRKVK